MTIKICLSYEEGNRPDFITLDQKVKSILGEENIKRILDSVSLADNEDATILENTL